MFLYKFNQTLYYLTYILELYLFFKMEYQRDQGALLVPSVRHLPVD
jgi:hypothetical protein